MQGSVHTIELSVGPVEYHDTETPGPTIVLVHGLLMDGRQWRKVVERLADSYRCVLPTLPMGAHKHPMHPDADVSLTGMVRILAEFLDALDLREVCLCFNDWCGAPVMIAEGLTGRVSRLVLVSCEAFENYPPGLAGHAAWLAAKAPGGPTVMRLTLEQPTLRKLPFIFGQMTKHGVPDQLMRQWLAPLRNPGVRRDFSRYAGDAMNGRRILDGATPALASFTDPVLVVWDLEGPMMPAAHGHRLADAFPNAELIELPDCYTLIPEDQPEPLAAVIREFLRPAGG